MTYSPRATKVNEGSWIRCGIISRILGDMVGVSRCFGDNRGWAHRRVDCTTGEKWEKALYRGKLFDEQGGLDALFYICWVLLNDLLESVSGVGAAR